MQINGTISFVLLMDISCISLKEMDPLVAYKFKKNLKEVTQLRIYMYLTEFN